MLSSARFVLFVALLHSAPELPSGTPKSAGFGVHAIGHHPHLGSQEARAAFKALPQHPDKCPARGGRSEPVCERCNNHGICLPGNKCACAVIWSGSPTCDKLATLRGQPLTTPFPAANMGPYPGPFTITSRSKAGDTLHLYHETIGDVNKFHSNIRASRGRDPLPTASKKLFPTCAVVSNSGALALEQHGAAIDRAAAVFRFNDGPTKGFERHVGKCTAFRFIRHAEETRDYSDEILLAHEFMFLHARPCIAFMSDALRPKAPPPSAPPPALKPSMSRQQKLHEILRQKRLARMNQPLPEERSRRMFGADCDKKFKMLQRNLGRVTDEMTKDENIFLMHPDWASYVASLLSGENVFDPKFDQLQGKNHMATLGFVGLWTALHQCAHVKLYGFFLSIDQGYLHHYWDKNNTETSVDPTRDNKEYDFGMLLAESGLIELDQPCIAICRTTMELLGMAKELDFHSFKRRAQCTLCQPTRDPVGTLMLLGISLGAVLLLALPVCLYYFAMRTPPRLAMH